MWGAQQLHDISQDTCQGGPCSLPRCQQVQQSCAHRDVAGKRIHATGCTPGPPPFALQAYADPTAAHRSPGLTQAAGQHGSSPSLAETHSAASFPNALMPSSKSYDDLSTAQRSGGSQVGPDLQLDVHLMAAWLVRSNQVF